MVEEIQNDGKGKILLILKDGRFKEVKSTDKVIDIYNDLIRESNYASN